MYAILFFVNLCRWAHFERVLEELVAQRIHYTSVEQLQTSAREDCLIDDDDEFQTVLNFYHNLGLIIKHRSTVVLEAKWLIDLFKELITIPRFDEAVRKKRRIKKSFIILRYKSCFSVVTLAIQLITAFMKLTSKQNAGFCCPKLKL